MTGLRHVIPHSSAARKLRDGTGLVRHTIRPILLTAKLRLMTYETAALTRAWPIICHLIGLAQLHLARLSPAGNQRWRLYSMTRLAESLVRRWLVLSACQADVWVSVQRTRSEPVSDATRISSPPRTHFRLAEPLPALAAWMFTPEPETDSSAHQAHSPFNPARLSARIAALSAVLAAPETHIHRMTRWLARAAARQSRTPCRVVPLGIGWPSGTSRAARRRNPEWVAMVLYLDQLAHDAVRRGRSP